MKGALAVNEDIFDTEINKKAKHTNQEIPEIVKARIEDTLSSLPKKRRLRKIITTWSAAAVLAFTCILASGFASPAMAHALKNVPIFGSVFKLIGDTGLKNARKVGLTEIKPQTISDNGVTITITDVIYDGSRLSFGYVIESKDGKSLRLSLHEGYDPYADGKLINGGGSETGKNLNDNKYIGTEDLESNQSLPEKFILGLRINKLIWYESNNFEKKKFIKGKWYFNIPISITKKDVIYKVFNPMPFKKFSVTKISLKSINITPATTGIKLEVSGMCCEGLEFNVFTNDGKMLDQLGSSSGGCPSLSNYNCNLVPIKRRLSYLLLKPSYLYEINTQLLVNKYPLKIITAKVWARGQTESIYLSKVEFLSDKTLLYVKGNYSNEWPISLKDASGKVYSQPYITYPKSSKNNTEFFIITFPALDKKQKIEILSPKLIDDPKILKQVEFKIPLE